jgi:hypothetical protein
VVLEVTTSDRTGAGALVSGSVTVVADEVFPLKSTATIRLMGADFPVPHLGLADSHF